MTGLRQRRELGFPCQCRMTDDNLCLPSAPTDRRQVLIVFLFCASAMNSNDDNQAGQDELRKRIASLMRANQQARRKPITGEELKTLENAAGRLDKMLNAAAGADTDALKSAAARLDQLLEDIRQGKDVSEDLKRRAKVPKRR